jgi:stearoyl-CoA desaturase (delta-9 desaturase)
MAGASTTATTPAPGAVPMTPVQKTINLFGVVLPFAGLLTAIVLLWDRYVDATSLAIALAMYLATGFGISLGFHRLLTHRSYETHRALRTALAILGSMALEGPVIKWVSNHRMHHAHADQPGDPHSPHQTEHGDGLGPLAGLAHAHLGWMLGGSSRALPDRYASDLENDPAIRFVERTFLLWVTLGLAIPAALGYAFTGTTHGAVEAFVWGGPVRIFALQHVTFAINSLCHFHGRKRFETGDESRNIAWLAPFSFGEAWHNNHHAFPTSAFHGLKRTDVDPSRWILTAAERAGLVWNVKRPALDRQAKRALAAPDTR